MTETSQQTLLRRKGGGSPVCVMCGDNPRHHSYRVRLTIALDTALVIDGEDCLSVPAGNPPKGEIVEHYCGECYTRFLDTQSMRDWRPEVVRRAKLGVLQEFAALSAFDAPSPTPMMKLLDEKAQSCAFAKGPKNALKKKGKRT